MLQVKEHKLHVHGMHCNGCVLLIENELGEHVAVSSVRPDLLTRTVVIHGDFGNKTLDEVATELNTLLSQHSLSTIKQNRSVMWSDFAIALPFALLFIGFFLLLQKLGIINVVDTSQATYGTAFVVGIIASLSTCMAVVGGLVLSMSATFAKNGDSVRPQIYFHVGRLIAFFLLGGVIGLAGAVFQLGAISTLVLGILIGLVMLVLGLNLLDIFNWTKALQFSAPKNFTNTTLQLVRLNHSLTPALVGVASFFLPCGFTQSMQIFTLSTGSFIQGGLTMLIFALGTFPVLALVSFSSLSIQNSKYSGVFYKTAGLVVIIFAVFNILNSLVGAGLIQPIFNL